MSFGPRVLAVIVCVPAVVAVAPVAVAPLGLAPLGASRLPPRRSADLN